MRLDRRTFLLGSAGALVAAGCGDSDRRVGSHTRELARRSVGIDYASYYAPIADVRTLVMKRAKELGVTVTMSEDPSGAAAQAANLREWTGPHGGFRAIAVAPFSRAAVEPIAASAIEDGIGIVSYVADLTHRSAAISVDRGRAGALLAAHARAHGDGGVLVVEPPDRSKPPDPFAPGFAESEAAIRRELPVRATVAAGGEADARALVSASLDSDPRLRTILCWNDTTALGAAAAARPGDYVGGLGAPSLTGRASLARLGRGGSLRCLVAPRLADLCDALVEVPFALARGERGRSRTVPVRVLTQGSPLVARYEADFAK